MSTTLFPNASPALRKSLGVFAALSDGYSPRLTHALGFAEELRRRVIVNGETSRKVAEDLCLEWGQVNGAVKILRYRFDVSPERLAVIVMKDPGLDDADIAEIFGRSVRWAAVVRRKAIEISGEEFIPFALEWPDPGLQPDDPTPEQIRQRAAELRTNAAVPRRDGYVPGIRAFRWSGKRGAPISVGVA